MKPLKTIILLRFILFYWCVSVVCLTAFNRVIIYIINAYYSLVTHGLEVHVSASPCIVFTIIFMNFQNLTKLA
jgi:hypothetical protein